jgi:hypothetical protein
MHSSTSSFERAGFIRQTASDRPGVAQPVPVRDIPAQPWSLIFAAALALTALMIGGWEYYWRAFGSEPGYLNSDGEWAVQRDRIHHGEGGKTVLAGSSRVLFDVQLPVWEHITGERPIQLALEGTSSIPVLEDLAADQQFTGRLLVGVSPDLFFGGFAFRGSAVKYFHKWSPSQRVGDWISTHWLEPYFAFYDPDFALATVLRRQPWPVREGMHQELRVRKLMVQPDEDRNSHMWSKVENDPEYREIARKTWAQKFNEPIPGMETPEKAKAKIDEQIDKAAKAVIALRARGVQVLFVRLPSAGEFYAYEQKYLPRTQTWDLLLQRTGVHGIHFEDYAELQGYESPEWSHLAASEATRFTTALVPIAVREFAGVQKLTAPSSH